MRITKHIKALDAYVYGEQPSGKNVIKINTNENAYPPSPKCAQALAKFRTDSLRVYPNAEALPLRKELAKLHKTSPQNIFVGNGSDEILTLAARAFVEDDESIGSLDPSYSLYCTLADIRNVEWKGQDEATFPACTPDTALFIWTNPNAPTGKAVRAETIAKFAKTFKGVVIIDEAYADFAASNCMHLATSAANRNIVVMRTFSKSYSLAGLRVGYCVGPKDLIAALFKIKDSYNVDAVAQAVALAAVKDQKWMKANVRKIVATRNWFSAELARRGWQILPSETNFIFAKPKPGKKAKDIFAYLKTKNIFIRFFDKPKTREYLRITIGTREQMQKVLSSIDKI